MALYTIYRSLLIFLLLCYGKKFSQGGPLNSINPGLSHKRFNSVPLRTGGGSLNYQAPRLSPSEQYTFSGRLSPIHLDINNRKSGDKYQYFVKNGIHTYIAFHGYYFHKITQGVHHRWELSDYKYPKRVTVRDLPKGKVHINVHYDDVLSFDMDNRRCSRGSQIFNQSDSSNQVHSQVQVVSRNPKSQESGSNLVILDINNTRNTNFFNYSFNVVNKIHIFSATPGYLFKLVKDRMEILWQSSNSEYANVVTVEINDKNERDVKVFLSDDAESDDEIDDELLSNVIDVQFPLSSVYPEEFLSPFEDMSVHESFSDYGSADELEGQIPITIDIMKRTSTEQFEFSKRTSNFGIYTPKHNFIFKVIKASGSTIFESPDILWHGTNPDQYATKIIVDCVGVMSKTNHATIILANGDSRHFSKSYKRWVEIEPLAVVDISRTEPGYEFDYIENKRSAITTFLPKGRFLFKGMKVTVSHIPSSYEIVIWETKNPKEYCKKILVKGHGKSERYVLLFLVGGGFKLFYAPERTNMWRDESANLSTIDTHKMFGVDIHSPKSTKDTILERYVDNNVYTPKALQGQQLEDA